MSSISIALLIAVVLLVVVMLLMGVSRLAAFALPEVHTECPGKGMTHRLVTIPRVTSQSDVLLPRHLQPEYNIALTASRRRVRRLPESLQERSGITALAVVHVDGHEERWTRMARRLSSWGIASPEEYAWPAVTPGDASAIVPVLQTWLRSFNARQSRRGRLLSKYEAACFASHWLLLTALGQAVKAGELAQDDWVLVLEDDVVCTDPGVPPHKVLDVVGEITRALPYDTDVFWWGTYASKDIPQADPTFKQRFLHAMRDARVPVDVKAWCGTQALMYRGRFLRSILEHGLQLYQGLLPIDHAMFASVAGRGGRGASCTRRFSHHWYGFLSQEPDVPSTLHH